MGLSINSNSGYRISEIDKKFQYQQLGIPDEVIAEGASAIEDYAYENGITLPTFETQQDEETLFEEPAENEVTQANAAQNSEASKSGNNLGYSA